jgi:mRNA-degrading endonuclease RelE of RelBE toxin-antitoxin system
MSVRVSEQVEAFLRSLAPDPRRRLRLAIRSLPGGDVKSLEGRLKDYQRLRCGSYRAIFATRVAGEPIHECIYAERRSIIYEAFEKLIGG